MALLPEHWPRLSLLPQGTVPQPTISVKLILLSVFTIQALAFKYPVSLIFFSLYPAYVDTDKNEWETALHFIEIKNIRELDNSPTTFSFDLLKPVIIALQVIILLFSYQENIE